ncbi:MAG: flagellar motor protein MotB [Armatimonadetes bacterium]|nr:flagellar motor protein MotB [Armatimonadota bacterium]
MSQHGRRKAHGEHENEERWLVTYADMITLLMAFFIMMYAMSIVNLGKFNELAVSVRSGFGGSSPGLRSASIGFEARRGQVPVQLPLNAFDVMSAIAGAIESNLSDREMKDLDFVSEDGMAKVRVRADDVLFARGSADLTPRAIRTLSAVADAVRDLPYDLRIEGHTCDLPITTGKFASNWELSAQRAINVVMFLIRQKDIPPSSLSAAGYADTSPVVPNTDEKNRRRNRRIDIVLLPPGGPSSATRATRARLKPVTPSIAPRGVQIVPELGSQSHDTAGEASL